MTERAEEEPEPDEPEPDEEPGSARSGSAMVPTVGGSGSREYEYRTELLSVVQLTDGTTLSDKLGKASADGWDLVDILDGGDQRVLLLRKPKRPKTESRPVGFAVRSSS